MLSRKIDTMQGVSITDDLAEVHGDGVELGLVLIEVVDRLPGLHQLLGQRLQEQASPAEETKLVNQPKSRPLTLSCFSLAPFTRSEVTVKHTRAQMHQKN